ncbi:MAG: VOC family protein [Lewinellaceae bacterium]|nr:VOC family protein [Saprospiraceae bacterium]MCB9337474.1 VOC family protein [Lewinellaceae bacterium]
MKIYSLILFFYLLAASCQGQPVAENRIVKATTGAAESEYEKGAISVGVVVSDLEKSLDFYTRVLGMQKTGGFKIDEDFGNRSGLSDGVPFEVTVLKLVDSPDAAEWKLLSFGKGATHPKQLHIQDDTGVQYVTLFVKAIQPILERIRQNNIPLLGSTPVVLKDGRQFILIQDPDGTFIELIGQ